MSYRFSILLILLIFFIWLFLFQAKDLPYDENFGSLFISFLLSLMTVLTIIWLFFKKRRLVHKNIILVVVFLLTSSPVNIYYVIMNYEYIFGKALDVG